MAELFDWFAGVVSTEGVDIAFGLLVTALGFYFNQMILTEKSREELAEALEENSPINRYRAVLERALDWIDRKFARRWGQIDEPNEEAVRQERLRPFSTRLFELSLTLALLYPAALILGLWALNVSEARVGVDFVILEAGAEEGRRLLALLALVVTLILTLMARSQRSRPGREWREFGWLLVAVFVVTTGVFAIIEANATAQETTTGRRELLSTAVITSLAAAVTVAAAGALRGATALAVGLFVAIASVLVWDAYTTAAGGETSGDRVAELVGEISLRIGLPETFFETLGFAPIAAVGVVLALLLAYAVWAPPVKNGRVFWPKGAILRAFAFMIGSGVGAVVGVLALGGVVDYGVAAGYGLALFVVIVVAQAASGGVRALSDAARSPVVSFLLFAAYLAVACVGFAWFAGERSVDVNLRMYFVIFAFLPTLNVAFDFLTAGATRFALRRGLAGDRTHFPFFWTAVDVLIALTLFVLLGLAMAAAGGYVRMTEDQPVFDAVAVVQDVRSDVGAYAWLLVAMFSTLAPTLAHLAIAIFSLVLMVWGRLSSRIARLVRAGGEHGGSRAIAAMLMTGFTIASVVIPPLLIVLLIAYLGPQASAIGEAYLDLLEKFAAWISPMLVAGG